MCRQYRSFENTVRKGEIARNEQFFLFPQCFLPIWRTFCQFHLIWNCRLQTLSVWKSLKFVIWERVKIVNALNPFSQSMTQVMFSSLCQTFNKCVLILFICICQNFIPLDLTPTTWQIFRLVQIESICSQQNKYEWKIEICFAKGRNTMGEKEKKHFVIFPQCFLSFRKLI